jgi:TPR repeat protein
LSDSQFLEHSIGANTYSLDVIDLLDL